MFELHPQLAKDCHRIIQSPLCHFLLMDDSRYPWVVLVPKRDNITELHHLPPREGSDLMADITRVCVAMDSLFQPDKLNTGALGNLVPQLHIHIIARYKTDTTWPGPVWGVGEAQRYGDAALEERLDALRRLLS